jgi:hypothetical protein
LCFFGLFFVLLVVESRLRQAKAIGDEQWRNVRRVQSIVVVS